ncbi:hypothetical protein ACFSQ3_04555 [Sphingobacterium corticis]|uniref:Uncharacterized protein n=1 Tax=Sphingobacterium corticis TaxID=1812823 RepID=A0ABW5NIF5_9SPHI
MAAEKDRKITYNTLIKRVWRADKDESPFHDITNTLEHVNKLKTLDKMFNLKGDRFCFLSSLDIDKNIVTGFFKSARHSFRPSLIDSKTGLERKSPKTITEGEVEKTHFLIKITLDEVFLLVETNGHGISTNQIVEYIDRFTKKYVESIGKKKGYSIVFYKIAKDNFIDEVNALKRVKIAKVYFDKQLLGSDCLNFSNRRISLQRDVELTTRAKKQENIKETALDFFNAFSTDEKISKVRVEGTNESDGKVVIDTSFIEKISTESVSLNPTTGEVISTEIITILKYLSEELE